MKVDAQVVIFINFGWWILLILIKIFWVERYFSMEHEFLSKVYMITLMKGSC